MIVQCSQTGSFPILRDRSLDLADPIRSQLEQNKLITGEIRKKKLIMNNDYCRNFSPDLLQRMKDSFWPADVIDPNKDDGNVNPTPGIPFCLYERKEENGVNLGYPEKFCRQMQASGNLKTLTKTWRYFLGSLRQS